MTPLLVNSNVSSDESPADSPGTSRDVELTIVMPCLNEAETLGQCVRKASTFLTVNGISGEVVVGDNGSTDGSQEIAVRNGARVVDVSTKGYGAAIYYATLAAKGRYVIMGDSDDSYDFSNLMPFVEQLRAGSDLVMGNRFSGGIAPGAMPWKNRYLGNPILSGIGRLFFKCPARDFHCGLRGYSREAFRRLNLQTTGMEFASEMVIKATLHRMRIAEVPTTLHPDGRSRAPHLRPWRDGWRHLRFMLLFSPRWLLLYPAVAMILCGLVGVFRLMVSPIELGRIVLDVHTMVYFAAMVTIGYQTLLFAGFARVFVAEERLMRPDPLLTKLGRLLTLEVGISVGVGLLGAGALLAIASLVAWADRSFGGLDPRQTMRLVVPATLLLTCGVQTIISSFFFSVVGLRTRLRRSGE